jgi:type I restriction enzyme S subunit
VYGGNGIAGFTSQPLMHEPTVVVGRVGQKCGEVYLTTGPAWITDNALYPRIKHRQFDTGFLALALDNAGLNDVRNRNDLPLVTQAILHSVQIAWPSEAKEQAAIVAALSDVDALLGGLDQIIVKKRDLKQAAMQRILTGQAHLSGFHGEWELKNLGSIAEVLKGGGLSKSLTSSTGKRFCILYGELFTTYKRLISEVVSRTDSAEGVSSIAGDVLMPGSTTTSGIDLATASALLTNDVALGGDINVIRRKRDDYEPVFLANYLTHAKKKAIAELTQGITIYHLYGRDLKRLLLELPSFAEQTAIASVLTDMDAELAALEQRREKTRALKQAMMQELLTGKTRLV